MLSFFSFKLHTFTHKVNGSSAYYKVVFLVLLFISWSVVSCPPRIYLSCYLWCLALWQALSRRRLQSGRQWIIASSYCSWLRDTQVRYCQLVNSRPFSTGGGLGYQLWRGSRWVPLLNHCWVPSWVPLPLLGAIGGCHARVPVPGPCNGCHCWSAIAGRLFGAMAGCHCSVPDASYQL